MIPRVVESIPRRSVLPLLALAEVAAVDVARCRAAGVAVDRFDAVEEIVGLGGGGGAGFVDPFATLAEGIVFEFGRPGGVPSHFLQARKAVPFVGTDAVGKQVAVGVVGKGSGSRVGDLDLVGGVGRVAAGIGG